MARPSKYPDELRERAVRMVAEVRPQYPSQWAAITAVAGIYGASTPRFTLAVWGSGVRVPLAPQRKPRFRGDTIHDRHRRVWQCALVAGAPDLSGRTAVRGSVARPHSPRGL